MFVAMLIWSLVMAVGFELARKERLYDYRRFLKALLGKGWVVFEFGVHCYFSFDHGRSGFRVGRIIARNI